MARVLSVENSYVKKIRTFNKSKSLCLRKNNKKEELIFKGNAKVSVMTWTFSTICLLLLGGFFYLYQVNDLAIKGFKIKEAENRIKDLGEAGKKLKIKETELRSMYTIEKETRDLNLVNSSGVSYIEINGPVAMK